MNHEVELINAIIDTEDIQLALARRAESLFEVHRDVWLWVKSYYDKYSQVPDKQKVKKKFPEFDFLSTKGTLEYYLDESHKAMASAKLMAAMKEAVATNKETGDAYRAVGVLSSKLNEITRDSGLVKDTDLAGDYEERVQRLRDQVKRNQEGKSVLGIATGIEPLDYHFGGAQPGDSILLMGTTGCGKSWLARLFAARAWEQGYRPLIVSLEMNKYQEGYRLDTILNQGKSFKNSQISHGRNVDVEEYEKWVTGQFVGKPSFHLVTREGMEVCDQHTVEAKIIQYRPDLVINDHFGLYEAASGTNDETGKYKELSKAFKNLAVKYQLPFYNVAQVTMDSNEALKRGPNLLEVGWSKSLAHDADLVLSIFRNKEKNNRFEISSKKNRRGEDFAFYLDWDLDSGNVQELYDVDEWD